MSVPTDPHAPSDALTRFEAERSHLFAVAYRMLGSRAEAEDILQEAYLRWAERETTDESDVESDRAFLTTVVVRLSIDHLKSARARRERYVGPWLPEPLVARGVPSLSPSGASSGSGSGELGPEGRVALAESLSLAFLTLLERLSPSERAAFLLREVFDQPYERVAEILGIGEQACRKLVSRAREHIDANRPRFPASAEKKQELLLAFLGACASGDAGALGNLLAADVVARSDGGGKTMAALKPVLGSDRVARLLLGIMKKWPPNGVAELATVNGEPGIIVRDETGVRLVVVLTVDDERIGNVWIVVNPDKLAHALDATDATGATEHAHRLN
ncbi:RNA polymerase sigma-70 factor [Labilithrix luteola]|uniref:RNA polymerase sigma-70 factor n=1 Tax=Labilithrix luteola TaxID=1391654 RepID=A0A0K1PL85_9BACT|nr:RNA polymerase sigma factor SigJ [Labilithrix luteola]AKU93879.1 RNA polymerase sigma-70 factor [Labilithrix luteola]